MNTVRSFLQPMLGDAFLRGMVLMVLVASLLPDLGRTGGWLGLDHLVSIGVACVFFLHGIGIPREQMQAGLSHWRLHLLVQSFTFAVFPLLFWLASPLLTLSLPPMLVMGFFYLCVLPSTITSSVAMTSMAKGNVAAAIVNATLSSLLGIFLTPLLVSLMSPAAGAAMALGPAIQKIATLLLLPFVLGQLLRPWWGAWFSARKTYTQRLDRGIILMLVLVAFSDSVAAGLWQRYGVIVLLETLIGVTLLLAMVLVLTRLAARRLGLAVEDEIVAVFCGSKKTLAAGVPMAKVLFGAHPALGLIVLPIMLYHQVQLMVCSALAHRYATRKNDGAAA